MTKKSDVRKVVKGIIKDFENAPILHGKKSSVPEIVGRTTGFPGFDAVLGIGGFPSGKFVEIFGPDGVGKTSLSLQVLAAGQALGEIVAYIDVEHALNVKYAYALGLKEDESFVMVQPLDGEDGFEIVRRLLEAGVSRIVIDSMAALLTKSELALMAKKGPAMLPQPGIQARMLSQTSKMLTPVLAKSGANIIFTNQERDTISPYGPATTTSGGKAPKYYERVRMRVYRDSAKAKQSGDWGFWAKVKIRKNNYSKPDVAWSARLVYGRGFDQAYDILQHGVDIGVIDKRGNNYIHQGQELGCGIEVAVKKLWNDPETMKLIVKDLDAKRSS